jgi:AbrB family looped-hinge helix DNA binding protein
VSASFVETAKLTSKGQITIPKDVRDALRLAPGDRVTFIVENGSVRIVNAMLFAVQNFQESMKGCAEESGLTSDEAVVELVKEIRKEAFPK